jgi:iron complex transport system substrate-binding protein
MKKTFLYSLVLASLLLTGCTSPKEKEVKSASSESSVEAVATEEKITYLDQEYAVKIPTTNIITASVETMEDAAAFLATLLLLLVKMLQMSGINLDQTWN